MEMIFYSGVDLRENSYTFHSYLKVTNNSLKLNRVYCCSEIHFPDLKISKVEHGYLNSSICKKPTHQNIILTDFICFGQFQRLKKNLWVWSRCGDLPHEHQVQEKGIKVRLLVKHVPKQKGSQQNNFCLKSPQKPSQICGTKWESVQSKSTKEIGKFWEMLTSYKGSKCQLPESPQS